jgi:hypothetical protein
VDGDQIGRLCYGNVSSFTNIYNFTDNIMRVQSSQGRPLSSLDIFNVSEQIYIALIWQPESIGLQYDLIRQVNGFEYESYSSTVSLTTTRTAKFIDYNSILVYDTSCQVVKVNPINPVGLNQGVAGFDPSIIVAAVAEKQDTFFGVSDYLEDSGLYNSSYLYSLNQKGEFVLKVTLNDSLTGSAFGSARFILNDSYLVVLQLQGNVPNTTNSTDVQISLYSIVDQTFREDSRIENVYSVGA